MPTIQSKFHAEFKGKLGKGSAGFYYYNPAGSAGITILNEQGNLSEPTKEVVSLVKEHNALIGTSHLSPDEIIRLVRYCRDENVRTIVNHLGRTPQYNSSREKTCPSRRRGQLEPTSV